MLVGAVSAAGMWALSEIQRVPPATPEQVEREIAFLKANFFTDPCFEPLREAQRIVEVFDNSPTYLVKFSGPSLAHDFLTHALVVRHEDRKAYLIQAGGLTGGYKEIGPVSIGRCLRSTFRAS